MGLSGLQYHCVLKWSNILVFFASGLSLICPGCASHILAFRARHLFKVAPNWSCLANAWYLYTFWPVLSYRAPSYVFCLLDICPFQDVFMVWNSLNTPYSSCMVVVVPIVVTDVFVITSFALGPVVSAACASLLTTIASNSVNASILPVTLVLLL